MVDGMSQTKERLDRGTGTGLAYANRIHTTGDAVVWSGHREVAEHYWNGLRRRGLTMAPLEN
jgi:ATP-dependent Clp protease adaptor protein ClpS